jgi:MYXO-CTERM domain-containing protein
VTSVTGNQGTIVIDALQGNTPMGYIPSPPIFIGTETLTGNFFMGTPNPLNTITSTLQAFTFSGWVTFPVLQIFDGGPGTAGPTAISYPVSGNGTYWDLAAEFAFKGPVAAGDHQDIPIYGSSYQAPEPSTLAAGAGILALLWAARRRRQPGA